jgi:hypothetical protein
MGYDITFHPIRPSEIKHFVFDVLDDSVLVSPRIEELLKIGGHLESIDSIEKGAQEFLQSFYENLLAITSPQKPDATSHQEIAYFCASLSSFIHPYWYTRGSFLSRFIQENIIQGGIFTSLRTYGSSPSTYNIEDDNLMIDYNYSASGYVDSTIACDISSLVFSQLRDSRERLLQEQQEFDLMKKSFSGKIKRFFNKSPDTFPHKETLEDIEYLLDNELNPENDDLGWALKSLEEYCKEHKTGFIEATEIISPSTGHVAGNLDNFRAVFLDHHLSKP